MTTYDPYLFLRTGYSTVMKEREKKRIEKNNKEIGITLQNCKCQTDPDKDGYCEVNHTCDGRKGVDVGWIWSSYGRRRIANDEKFKKQFGYVDEQEFKQRFGPQATSMPYSGPALLTKQINPVPKPSQYFYPPASADGFVTSGRYYPPPVPLYVQPNMYDTLHEYNGGPFYEASTIPRFGYYPVGSATSHVAYNPYLMGTRGPVFYKPYSSSKSKSKSKSKK